MAHFYESVIMTSKDGLQLKSYTNEHPKGYIIAKPKYIPNDKIQCDAFASRDILGRNVHRMDVWIDQEKLRKYIADFKNAYPDYIYDCDLHGTWFFAVPENKIESIPDNVEGTKKIVNLKEDELDDYLTLVQGFLNLLHDSGLSYNKIGVTNSTLLGTYTYGRSDMDIIIYGKQNYWDIMDYMKNTAKHDNLRWKNRKEWEKYYASYNCGLNFSENEFIWQSERKASDGWFDNTIFSIFGVSEANEEPVKWGDEKYERLGPVSITADVIDNYNAATRPGYYEIENTRILNGPNIEPGKKIDQVVTYARDFMLQAFPGEKITATGMLEKAVPYNGNGDEHYRVTVGYFDSYIDRRGTELIKVMR